MYKIIIKFLKTFINMAKISNLEKYPIKENISLDDYVLITDTEDSNKTKNAKVIELNKNIFSETERLIGEFDGQPLYRKTIPFQFIGNDYYHINVKVNIKYLIKVEYLYYSEPDEFGNSSFMRQHLFDMLRMNDIRDGVTSGNGVSINIDNYNILSFGGDNVNISSSIIGKLIIDYIKI